MAEVLNFYKNVNRSSPGQKSYLKLPGFEPCRKVYDAQPQLISFLFMIFSSVRKTLIIRTLKIPRIVEVGQIGFHERKKRFWFGYILRIGRISI